MKTDVRYSLSSGRDGLIDGSIFLDGKEYYLDMIPEDIIDALSAVTGRSVNVGFFVRNPVKTIEDIPLDRRKEALEVKLKLLACIQKLDECDMAKVNALEIYHAKREDLTKQYQDDMVQVEKELYDKLK